MVGIVPGHGWGLDASGSSRQHTVTYNVASSKDRMKEIIIEEMKARESYRPIAAHGEVMQAYETFKAEYEGLRKDRSS